MAEYYVEKSANEAGDHLVHSAKCSSLPAVEAMHYLGAYSSVTAPVNISLDRYVKVATCPDCLPA